MVRTALLTAAAGAALATLGAVAFIWSGVYQIAANEPHRPPFRWMAQTLRTRSVQFYSRNIAAEQVHDAELLRRGLTLYVVHCEVCHGGPGVPAAQAGRGINPTPPPLVTAIHEWTDPQAYFILSRGLKMSGMPAFEVRMSEAERWALVAFIRRLPLLNAIEYRSLAAAAVNEDEEPSAELLGALTHGDYGFAALRAQGQATRGRRLFLERGCGSCHIAESAGAGRVGPTLERYAERQYVAGTLVNVPDKLSAWIQHPQRFRPRTAMPDLGINPEEALDLVAFLYSMGDPKRIHGIERTVMPQTELKQTRKKKRNQKAG